MVEEKFIKGEDGLVYWNKFEYNEEGNLLKEISLDENGNPDGIYEYLPYISGLMSGWNFISNDSNYLKQYLYQFNDLGHWVNQIIMKDGEPQLFYDREIEYY